MKARIRLVYGDHDGSRVAERQRTSRALGNADIVTIPDRGHFGFVDNPERLVEVVLERD